jgi:RND family efflux transporter MFP subunit
VRELNTLRRSLRTALLCGSIPLALTAGCGGGGAGPARPPQVEVANVTRQDVSIYGEWVATLDGYVNAQIQPQVTGYVIRQDYREGAFVHQGDVLFEIDPRPFQAALDLAKAQLAQSQAQLGNAELNVKRDVPEAKANAIPQMQLENDTQTQLATKASVQAAQAAVEQAGLNLGFTKVRSLISGIAGIAQVQVGNLVTLTTVLTAVSAMDPIKAYFPVSGEEYLRIADRINPADVHSTPQRIPLQLILSDGSTFGHGGYLLFADRAIDQQTGTIRLVGAFPNPGNILRPGQYGKVRAVTQILKGALLVPQRAVTELQGSYEVAVVAADDKVAIRTVQTGARVGTMWVITSGLKAGERVVAEGTQKATNGSSVTPVPFRAATEGG